MTDESFNDELSLAQELDVDRICMQFEVALIEGKQPSIEDELKGLVGPTRSALLRQLLLLEIECGQRTSNPKRIDNYRSRFPHDESLLRDVFSGGSASVVHTEVRTVRQSDSSSGSFWHGRFEPGQRVAGRYRIVSLLGKGGMGEVYRADDLVLGQPVALKFLPEGFASDSKRLEYFFGEVRLARQVSHPHVCRVHDIGEVDGQHFISMEFIDGEDLKTLLHRIGRLPKDKGLEIAQQICLGLAAAHERGVIHRDLKPANVMIDGRGHVRIMDFGLATISDDDRTHHSLVGTPAYMAPEQLLSGQTSEQSDIYSLGLVIYELFTGCVAREQRSSMVNGSGSAISYPSDVADDVDPNIDEFVVRCLQDDPARRPNSVVELLGLLPSIDPIAAALAAGQTPSPEAVAAAGGTGVLSIGMAILLIAVTSLGLTGIVILDGNMPLHFGKPPIAMRVIAESMLEHAGLPVRAHRHTAHGFRYDADLLGDKADPARRAEEYWYRSSPQLLVPHGTIMLGRGHSRVRTLYNPPPLLAGMISVRLNADNFHLRELMCIPAQTADATTRSGNVSTDQWRRLFADAGLDFASFSPNQTHWQPPFVSTAHVWSKSNKSSGEDSVSVQAATVGSQVVFFQVVWPEGLGATTTAWTLDRSNGTSTWGWQAMSYRTELGQTNAGSFVRAAFIYAWLIPCLFVAAFHYRRGTCNVRGSVQLAIFLFVIYMIVAFLEGDHSLDFVQSMIMFDHAILVGLIRAIPMGILYAAMEPLIRAQLPHTMISWNRLLTGSWDAMVDRDALIGCAVACCFANIPAYLDEGLGFSEIALMGPRQALAQIPVAVPFSCFCALFILNILLLLKMTTRRLWIGCIIVFAAVAMPHLTTPKLSSELINNGVATVTTVLLLVRYGLVAGISFHVFNYILVRFPITNDMDRWYASTGMSAVVLVFAVAIILGYRAVTGQRDPRARIA